MNGLKEIEMKLRAGYVYFYVQTTEILEVVEELQNINGQYKPNFWDFSTSPDPDQVIEALKSLPAYSVMVARNFNWFLQDFAKDLNKEYVAFLQANAIEFSSRESRKALIIVGTERFEDAIPEALQKDFTEVNFDLPTAEVIESIVNDICEATDVSPDEKTRNQIVQEMKGLTQREITNALAYCVIKHSGEFNLKTLAEIKAVEIERTAGLKLGQYEEDFDSLKGYEKLKSFTLRTINSPFAKGLILLGPPGTGKSMFAKALSNEAGKKMIVMEVAELFGGLVGESEKLMKTALDFIRANAPCILFVDEIEKALAGVGGQGANDGGTTKRSMAQFLKFLSDDRPEGIYVIATCNDITSLPPEWVRAERWDTAPFFIDLPNAEEREEILKHYLKVYDVKGKAPDMEGWSGAEIRAMCRIAAMMEEDISEVSDFIVPVSDTMSEEIDKLRTWAKKRTISASKLTLAKPKPKSKRSINLN